MSETTAKFIQLAGEINIRVHEYVVSKLVAALDDHVKAFNGARILLMGFRLAKLVVDTRGVCNPNALNVVRA